MYVFTFACLKLPIKKIKLCLAFSPELGNKAVLIFNPADNEVKEQQEAFEIWIK